MGREVKVSTISKLKVSVCMATYNGSPWIESQLCSILNELDSSDEVVVVDDCSSDDTAAKVMGIGDSRVRLIRNIQNVGHVQAFSRSIASALGDVLVLSDQDDLWIPGRVQLMTDLLSDASVCATGFIQRFPDSSEEVLPRLRFREDGVRGFCRVLNELLFGKGPYWGCAMAFRADVRELILPIPSWVESHDHWIALAGGALGGVRVSPVSTVIRRLHERNVTPRGRRSVTRRIRTRLLTLRSALSMRLRCTRLRWRL